MQDAKVEARIRRKFRLVAVELDERRRRQWAAAEARDAGWGGISLVARATGLSRPTIMAGLKELELSSKSRRAAAARVRSPGGGRRPLTQSDPGLLEALERLIDPATRGDPMSPLRWTCKSTAKLAEELTRQNHPVIGSHRRDAAEAAMATACRPTARRAKVRRTRTAMLSSSTSTGR